MLHVLSSGVLTRMFRRWVWEKMDVQGFSSSDRTHGSHRPRVRSEPYILPLCLPFMPVLHGHIASFGEAAFSGILGHTWVRKSQVKIVRKR